MTGVAPDDALPLFVRAFEVAEGNGFETTAGKVGCGPGLTINRSALFVADHKTPDFILSVAAGVTKRRVLKYQIFFFNLQLQTSHFTRLHGFRSCRPSLPEKKGFLSDVTEKKPQQCALLSAPLRGVQQPSTSTELFCLILRCRLCLSFFQRLNTKALPQR